jgi:predicted membrane-bound spermidine synthase
MQFKKRLYIISFFEGASVMAAEICSAKLLAPFFGSSLYVWSSVMAITLAGLAGGYFFGGKLSKQNSKINTLFWILLIGVCYMMLMAIISSVFKSFAIHLPLIPAVILSTFVLLFPVMFLMGTSSPLIISVLTDTKEQSGENAGSIYAISTLGGILSTFLSGFYLIPSFGIIVTLFFFSVLLFVSLFLLKVKINQKISSVFVFTVLCFFALSFSPNKKNNSIYHKDGLLGRVEVVDEPLLSNPSVIIRRLLVNNVVQTEMNMSSGISSSEYITLLKKNMNLFPKGKALILGLGGGLVANEFINNNYEVSGVEFDERIIYCAQHYFQMNSNINAVCDDARHFMNHTKDKYQLVLFDLFKAEEQPSHVLTYESLIQLKNNLDSNAIVLINTHGYLNSERGLGTQCLINTLKKAGYDIKVLTTGAIEDYRNIIILASLQEFKQTFHQELYPIVIENNQLINTDKHPILEKLNADANMLWRKNYLANYILNK